MVDSAEDTAGSSSVSPPENAVEESRTETQEEEK